MALVPLSPDNVAEFSRMVVRFYAEEPAYGVEMSLSRAEEQARQFMRSPERVVAWVVAVDGEIQGHLIAVPYLSNEYGGNVLWLDELHLEPRVRLLMGFLALYFVDVGKASPAEAALAVSVWTGVGLIGDFLLMPLLSRVKGLAYLRVSARIMLVLFPLFLPVPWFWLKLVLVGLLGFFNSGWYAILQAQIYASLPDRSGTAVASFNLSCLGGALIPLLLGAIAQAVGLSVSMWLLLLGPLALLVGIRRRHMVREEVAAE